MTYRAGRGYEQIRIAGHAGRGGKEYSTMSIMRPTEPWSMTAEKAAQRTGFASRAELVLRNALETFCRERWPAARVVHEIVMGEGRVRADVAAIDTMHIAPFEARGGS